MSIQHVLGLNWSGPTGSITIPENVTETGVTELNLDFTVAGTTTNQQEPLVFTVAKLVSFYMVSDQALTVKTNSSGGPQETIVLAAGIPYLFVGSSGQLAAFAGNVSTAYFSNAGSVTANVKIRSLQSA